ncbi:PIN domain-containing protein [Micromonospora aurantiaca (nom. illeg.)]|uniref:PIN domain-containing protein n=1 Tax=Micromonospora aurantiaca (nom. illeg.) TaxID=47850 RepID=UPI00366368A5
MRPEDVPDGPLLIDTDVVSYWLMEAEVGREFSTLTAGHEQAVSFATYGELLANAHRSRWGERRIEALRNQLKSFVVVPYTSQVVELWAEMHAKLSGHLQKGGANDLWTAACALALRPQLPVVTNNMSDFGTISRAFPELQLIHPKL